MGGIQPLTCKTQEWIRALHRYNDLPATGGTHIPTLVPAHAARALDEELKADKEKEEKNEEEEVEDPTHSKAEQRIPAEEAKEVATLTEPAAEAPTPTQTRNPT
ncbi:MAG: hypothetical protein Q9204_008144 [Flavoplaca sp. TL-2023a]